MNGGGGRGGSQQWAQTGSYPPHQEYYGNRGGSASRGGRGPSSNGPLRQGSRDDRGPRAGGGRGYPNGGPGGRGGRLVDMIGDPARRPPRMMDGNKKSPPPIGWDNPFPAFPGAKGKNTVSEEKKMIEKMEHMDFSDDIVSPRQGKAPNVRRSEDQNRRGPPVDGFEPRQPRERRPTGDSHRRPSMDARGRPSVDSQRMPPRGYPPSQPPQQNGYGRPPPNRAYFDDRAVVSSPTTPTREEHQMYGERSMTMPHDHVRPPIGVAPGQSYGSSAPYSGPVGRLPPRPSTANGTRPPPQRFYQNQPVPQSAYPALGPLYAENYDDGAQGHQPTGSMNSLYDHYLYDRDMQPQSQRQFRTNSGASDMPNFDSVGPNQRSMEPQTRTSNGGRLKLAIGGSHPDMRAMAQAQSAEVFDMAHELPPIPAQYQQQGYGQDSYGQYDNQMSPNGPRGPPPQGYPPRTASGPGLRSNPPPMNSNGSMPPQQPTSLPKGQGLNSLPAHPTPVRPGLLTKNIAAPMNNAPVPVRQYDNVGAAQNVPAHVRTALSPNGEPLPPPVTPEELEHMRQMMRANPNGNLDGQLLYARKLVEASDVLVARLPDQKQRQKAREKYIFEAHKILKKLVAAQHPESMFYLADCYGRGQLGLQMDNKEAFTLYQGAAKVGHPAAAYRTAVCCELGNEDGGGTRKDPQKAVQWYARAATLGDTPGMYKIGMILLGGLLGHPKNPLEAVGWLKKAAERADADNPHALHALGLLYEKDGPDNLVSHDERYALSLFTQAAKLGYKFSQFKLGCAYEYGLLGLQINPRDSIMWYSRAAVQEEHQSELALSGWYLTGSEGILQQSDTEAYLWARKAAMAGLAKAEYAMGYFTEVGIGAQSNLEDAKRWYWRAAAQNFPKARERLEDLKKGGSRPALRARERISRSKVGKQNEGECTVM